MKLGITFSGGSGGKKQTVIAIGAILLILVAVGLLARNFIGGGAPPPPPGPPGSGPVVIAEEQLVQSPGTATGGGPAGTGTVPGGGRPGGAPTTPGQPSAPAPTMPEGASGAPSAPSGPPGTAAPTTPVAPAPEPSPASAPTPAATKPAAAPTAAKPGPAPAAAPTAKAEMRQMKVFGTVSVSYPARWKISPGKGNAFAVFTDGNATFAVHAPDPKADNAKKIAQAAMKALTPGAVVTTDGADKVSGHDAHWFAVKFKGKTARVVGIDGPTRIALVETVKSGDFGKYRDTFNKMQSGITFVGK